MDIASRIKKFLDFSGIQSSRFADACGIPRPSFSQLLNGRNRTVSNEVFNKIHKVYPNLSIDWLMFGEGNMLRDENIEISEAQNEPKSAVNSPKEAIDEEFMAVDSPFSEQEAISTEKLSFKPAAPQPEVLPRNDGGTAPKASAMSLNVDSSRRVVNIMVFYSDNSFETFVPK